MENRKTEIGSEEKLRSLILKYSGRSNFKNDDCLEWDLGITGDDALDLLMAYSAEFEVNISNFKFDMYFHDEGQNILLMIRKLLRKQKKVQFTIEHLLLGIEKGEL